MAAVAEGTGKNTFSAERFLSRDTKFFVAGPAGDYDGIRCVARTVRAVHVATLRKELYPRDLSYFRFQAILLCLIHHRRREHGTGYTLGKPGIVLYGLHIPDVATEAFFVQKEC